MKTISDKCDIRATFMALHRAVWCERISLNALFAFMDEHDDEIYALPEIAKGYAAALDRHFEHVFEINPKGKYKQKNYWERYYKTLYGKERKAERKDWTITAKESDWMI